jgi:hypothetical protein
MRPEAHTFTAKDGRELTFLFDHRGIVAVEKIGEGNFGEVMAGMAEGKLGCMVAMVAGGLRSQQPDFTVEDAWDLLEAEDKAMGEALGEAIKSSRPGQMAVRAAGANPPKARTRRGTGTRSSPPGSKKA